MLLQYTAFSWLASDTPPWLLCPQSPSAIYHALVSLSIIRIDVLQKYVRTSMYNFPSLHNHVGHAKA